VPAKTESNKATAGKMPIMRHLVEVRNRVFKSVIAIIIGTVLGFIFAPQIIQFLKAPAGNIDLVFIELLENMVNYFKVSLTAGIILAMPLLVYQLFAFVSPALTTRERRSIYLILPAVMAMFLTGVAFAYYIALPPAMSFFSTFGSGWVNIQPTISSYINVVTRLMIGVGIVFETPIIIMVLTRMGLVTPKWLAARRKLWIVLAFVLAAIITPTFDPINQSIIAIPLIILLEVSILLSKLIYKKRAKPPATEARTPPQD
jgi:sec-independent protein translocase protein TatC